MHAELIRGRDRGRRGLKPLLTVPDRLLLLLIIRARLGLNLRSFAVEDVGEVALLEIGGVLEKCLEVATAPAFLHDLLDARDVVQWEVEELDVLELTLVVSPLKLHSNLIDSSCLRDLDYLLVRV
jgi:hypothetical protein